MENFESKWNAMRDQLEGTVEKNKKISQLLDGCAQLEKFLTAKESMVDALGAPSTEAAFARSQIAQIQNMKYEADAERSALGTIFDGVKQLSDGNDNDNPLFQRAVYGNLLAKEGEVPVVKSLVATQLKKKHDPELKSKCDELTKNWNPILTATKDRKSAVEKASELIKQFNEAEKLLSGRLRDDEKEIEAVVTSEDGNDVLLALEAVEKVLARRKEDADALAGLADAIDRVARGPEANKLKRKAENLLDDCEAVSRKAKVAAGASKRKADLKNRLERVLSESKDFASNQEKALQNDSHNKDRVNSRIGEVTDFWNRRKRDISNCIDELKEAGTEIPSLSEEVPVVAGRFEEILGRLNELGKRLSDKQDAAARVLD